MGYHQKESNPIFKLGQIKDVWGAKHVGIICSSQKSEIIVRPSIFSLRRDQVDLVFNGRVDDL